MKIALCLSGQPRFVEECYPSIRDNVIDVNSLRGEVDVFMHGWTPDEKEPYKFGGDGEWKNKRLSQNDLQKAQDLYDPVAAKFEPQIEFKDPRIDFLPSMQKYMPGAENKECLESGMTPEEYAARLFRNIMSMWYSRREANLLKEAHEARNGFKYDAVISSRYDLYVNSPLKLFGADTRIVHVPAMGKPDDEIADWLAVSSSDWMNIYCNVYTNIFYHYAWFNQHADGTFSSERMLWNQLRTHGVPVLRRNMHLDLPRF
tara:strand:+ start:973 stop:1749 length:777 start_codon:yes stop_codon:yes gene_type:complete